MTQRRARAALAHEALADAGAGTIRPDDPDGDLVAEKRPAGAVDRSHAGFGERRNDLVASVEDLPGREHAASLNHGAGEADAYTYSTLSTFPHRVAPSM